MKRMLPASILGLLAGYFLFHPFVMVVSSYMFSLSHPTDESTGAALIYAISGSFSASMLPWSLSFALCGGIVGFFYGKSKQANEVKAELIHDLQHALSEVKTLSGLLPICSSCKKIRDDKGYWNQIEAYIRAHSNADFTHGICPQCAQRLYPEHYKKLPDHLKNG